MENGGQILHQLPEVHPLVGGEVEQNLAAVKGHLRGNQLHIQPVLRDFFHADVVSLFLLGPVVRRDALILSRGLAQNSAQRGHHILLCNSVIATGTDTVFRPPGGVDNHMIPGPEGLPVGVKIVNLLSGAELDVHDLHALLRGSIVHFLLHKRSLAKSFQIL